MAGMKGLLDAWEFYQDAVNMQTPATNNTNKNNKPSEYGFKCVEESVTPCVRSEKTLNNNNVDVGLEDVVVDLNVNEEKIVQSVFLESEIEISIDQEPPITPESELNGSKAAAKIEALEKVSIFSF